jgi:hypothetical protein
MARRSRGISTSARWLAGAAVAVLAIAAIVLTVAAIERVRPEPVAVTPIPTFSFGSQTRPTTPTPSTTPTSSAPVPSTSAAEQRFLSAGSGGIWRATAGACNGPSPVVERSVDGGQTWTDVTPVYKGIRQVISLSSFAGTEAEMIAAVGPNCDVQALRTFTQGEFWDSYADVLRTSTYRSLGNTAELQTPAGLRAAPCSDPRGIRATGDTIALICHGIGQVSVGSGWRDLGPATAVALTADAVLVGTTVDGCDGLALLRITSTVSSAQSLGCADGTDLSAPTAIASDATSLWVWSADWVSRIGP